MPFSRSIPLSAVMSTFTVSPGPGPRPASLVVPAPPLVCAVVQLVDVVGGERLVVVVRGSLVHQVLVAVAGSGG